MEEGTGGQRGRVVPWGLLALWVVVIALAAPLAAKLSDVQKDRPVDYLPASADSTQVAELVDKLPGGEVTELVLVYHRDGGLGPADRAVAAREVAGVAARHRLNFPPSAVPSKDGTTVMYAVSSNEPGAEKGDRIAYVKDIRATVTGRVGGPDAFSADAQEVFGSLDGPLLYTTVAVVAILLVLIYRSPLLWLVPLVAAGVADYLAMAVAYALNQGFDLSVSGQSTGIMTVLVFGAGTDYALLIISRYREELRRFARPYDAMRAALRGCGPAVLASAGTVSVGMLCLLAADMNTSRGMGPAAAVGVLCALAAMTTLLPALLVLLGRRVFWPRVPAYGSAPKAARRSLFAAMGSSAGRRPVAVLAVGIAALGALSLGVFNLPGSLKIQDTFTTEPESISVMRTLAAAYPEQGTQPITVMAKTPDTTAALRTARAADGVLSAEKGRSADGWTEITVLAKAAPQTSGETATIKGLRADLRAEVGDGALVGGPSAEQIDLTETSARDARVVVPLVLVSVLIVLILLLRSLVAPLLLVAAVVAVWGAALGIGGMVFEPVFGYAGTDQSLPLLSFVFLVALGVDYGIFLMHRTREECLAGAEPRAAALTALRTTGGVIASAGLVLAATFGVLLNMPMVQLAEIGLVIAVGVLLDTFLVRTYLVTGASVLLNHRVWWPGPLSRRHVVGGGQPDPGNRPDYEGRSGRAH
ncbi:MMPL family transporter [Streptomyces sp. NPDC046203]|uniref:MMPL family transporter n=1 Tax=Streptomyces sp. NPDC046203 TaxID=3154602 RepID=UPI0034096808